MNNLASVIEMFLKRRKMWNIFLQNRLISDWEAVVGERISSVSRAVKIHNRILRVAVRDSTWSYHLSLLKPQIIKKINEHVGKTLINDIFFYNDEVQEKMIKGDNRDTVEKNIITNGTQQHQVNNLEENNLKLQMRLLKQLIQ